MLNKRGREDTEENSGAEKSGMMELTTRSTSKSGEQPSGSKGAEEEAPIKPQKKFYRTRAHTNVLNANDFWFPVSPACVPWQSYFPIQYAQPDPSHAHASKKGHVVEFVDIGCGYGSLLIALAAAFPSNLMLGIEIRPKVVEYVQKRVLALRHEAASSGAVPSPAADTPPTRKEGEGDTKVPDYGNVWAIHNNAMRFMPNFFEREQLTKLFICFPDPHFKRKNHRKRIITPALLAEFAYTLRPGGIIYCITDVSELMEWMVGHLTSCVLFDRLSRETLRADPVVPLLIATDEGLKVQRNNGNMFIAAFSKRFDPAAPRAPPPLLGNDEAAAAAADAGYTPRAGGELRGNTW